MIEVWLRDIDWTAGLEWIGTDAARALFAALTAFAVALAFGPWFIARQKRRRVLEKVAKGDSARLDLMHLHKERTPTMGGVILLVGVSVSTLLWTRLGDGTVAVLLGFTLLCGGIGWLDDRTKLGARRRKGMTARTKLTAQVIASTLAGAVLWAAPREASFAGEVISPHAGLLLPFAGGLWVELGVGWIALVVLVTTSSSNAANLTDGLDGLASGVVAFVALTLAVLALAASTEASSAWLGVPYIDGAAEVGVFAAALLGSTLGFLWFNCHPAQIFMGDTGSLAIGGAVGLAALVLHLELILLLAGGVLVAEALSVLLQVGSFKLTGRRIFRCAPLHHHFQFADIAETSVVVRFWIAGAVCSVASFVLLRSM